MDQTVGKPRELEVRYGQAYRRVRQLEWLIKRMKNVVEADLAGDGWMYPKLELAYAKGGLDDVNKHLGNALRAMRDAHYSRQEVPVDAR
jgi:hypothetical protein